MHVPKNTGWTYLQCVLRPLIPSPAHIVDKYSGAERARWRPGWLRHLQEVGNNALDAAIASGVSRSPMCWLMKACRPTLNARCFSGERPPPGSSAYHRAAAPAEGHSRARGAGAWVRPRTIHATLSSTWRAMGARMNEESVSNTTQPLKASMLVRADRLISQIAAGGDDGKVQLAQKQVVQWRIG